MKYIKDNVIISLPVIPNVVNATHETFLAHGWQVYEEPIIPYEPTHPIRITAPKFLAVERMELLLYKMRFEVMGLPVEDEGTNIVLWCKEIVETDKPLLRAEPRIKVEVWDEGKKEFVIFDV